MSSLVYGKMLQIYPLYLAIRAIDVDGKIWPVLAIIGVSGVKLVWLFITEFNSSRTKKIADLAFFIRFTEDRPPVHILEESLDSMFLPILHIILHGGVFKLIPHRIAGTYDIVGNGGTEAWILLRKFMVDLNREILRSDRRLFSRYFADNIKC